MKLKHSSETSRLIFSSIVWIDLLLQFSLKNYCKASQDVIRTEYGCPSNNMMMSSNGNIFRVTGPLCGEFTGPGEFPTQRPVARSFDVFFDLRLNKRLNKQPWDWWLETSSWSLWRQSQINYGNNNYGNKDGRCKTSLCYDSGLVHQPWEIWMKF